MRISASKSEAMVFSWKRVDCQLQVRTISFPQMKEFKYLGILFTSEWKMEQEIDRQIRAASTVIGMLQWSVMVKRELNQRAKVSIYRSI